MTQTNKVTHDDWNYHCTAVSCALALNTIITKHSRLHLQSAELSQTINYSEKWQESHFQRQCSTSFQRFLLFPFNLFSWTLAHWTSVATPFSACCTRCANLFWTDFRADQFWCRGRHSLGNYGYNWRWRCRWSLTISRLFVMLLQFDRKWGSGVLCCAGYNTSTMNNTILIAQHNINEERHDWKWLVSCIN